MPIFLQLGVEQRQTARRAHIANRVLMHRLNVTDTQIHAQADPREHWGQNYSSYALVPKIAKSYRLTFISCGQRNCNPRFLF